MFHWHVLSVSRLQVLVQDGKNLVVEDLEFADSVHHLLQGHTLDDLILAVVLLHLEKVIAEVEDVKASLLSQEGNDHATGPVEAVSKALPGEQERVA